MGWGSPPAACPGAEPLSWWSPGSPSSCWGCWESLEPSGAPSITPACIQPPAAPGRAAARELLVGIILHTNHILRVTRFCCSLLTVFSRSSEKRLSSLLPPRMSLVKDFSSLGVSWLPGRADALSPARGGDQRGHLHGAALAEREPATIKMMCL